MAVNLSPVAGAAAQFFDNSGQVLTGGKLYTYDAGTTTPAPTYTNSSGATAQPNPIILNAAGRVPDSGEIWLADSVSYKFVLKDQNDVLIGTYDNLVGINSNFVNFTGEEEQQTATQGQTVFTLATLNYQPDTNNLLVFVNGSKQISGTNYVETSSTVITFVDGLNVGDVVDFCTATPINTTTLTAAQVTYLPSFGAAEQTTVQLKLEQYVSVNDFGAVGDGTTDDTAAVQAAINYAIANKKGVVVPGMCLITSSINIDKAVDDPNYDGYLYISSTTNGGFKVASAINMFSSTLPYTTSPVVALVAFQNINFESTDPDLSAYVLDSNKFLRTQFTSCTFSKIRCLTTTNYVQSIYFFNCNMRRWHGVFFTCRESTYDVKFQGCLAEAGVQFALLGTDTAFKGPNGCSFIGNTIEGMSDVAIQYGSAAGLTITGNYFEGNGQDIDGLNLGGSNEGVAIIGNFYSHPYAEYSVLWGTCTGCVSMGNYGLGNINFISATSLVAINDHSHFSNVANTGGGVSNSGYGEGNFIPVFRGGNSTLYTYTVTSAKTTRNGKQVTFSFKGTMTSTGTNATETFYIPSELGLYSNYANIVVGHVQIVDAGNTRYDSSLFMLTTSSLQSTTTVIPANVSGNVFQVSGYFSYYTDQVN